MPIFSHTFLQADVPYNLGNGQVRSFSRDELREYVDNTRRMIFDGGLDVGVKSEHPLPGAKEGGPVPREEFRKQFRKGAPKQFADALRNAGWVHDLEFDEASGAANVFFDIKAKDYVQALRDDRIRFSSPELLPKYQDGVGREWGKTFAHFALTPKPRNPLQTRISEDSAGRQQFAMQFSMADAVGIEPKDLPTIQFHGKYGRLPKRSPEEDRYTHIAGSERNRSDLGPEQDIHPERGQESPRRHNLGQGEDRSPGVGNDPASRRHKKTNHLRDTRPQKHYVSGPDGWEPAEENINPHDKERENFGDLSDSVGNDQGLPRMSAGVKERQRNYRPRSKQQKPQMSEQFDTNMMDQAPGYPGAVPPISVGPQDFDPSGLGGQTNMLGGLPLENPDVIQAPDDQKRQKSEAAVQLLDQIGISLAVGTDLTKLDDSALDSLLAALKTKIKANQEAEEAEMASMQDQQLKEQVPMIGQMSENEADAIIGRTLIQIAQFGPEGPGKDWSRGPKRPKPKLPQSGVYGASRPKKATPPDRNENPRPAPRPRTPPLRRPGRRLAPQEDQEATAMSEEVLHKRLANFKQRHDKQARQGLRKLIAVSKLPPGMKAKLAGDVSSVQFAESGPEVPTYTVQDVIDLFNGSCPDGMQFGDKALVDKMDEPDHPRGDRWGKRGSENNGMDDMTAQFAADGVTMSKSDLEKYYDEKAKQPDWAKRLMPVANGNGRTH